jgi:hypothetical protein
MDKHVVLTGATGLGFAMGRMGLFPAPARTLPRQPPQRKLSGDDSPSDIGEGRIKVITVVEQDVGDESEIVVSKIWYGNGTPPLYIIVLRRIIINRFP